jgi:hypothetical protein
MLTGGQCEIGGTVSCRGRSSALQIATDACRDNSAHLTGFQGTCGAGGIVQYCCERGPSPTRRPDHHHHGRRRCSSRGVASCGGFFAPEDVARQACATRDSNLKAYWGSCPGGVEYCCGFAPPTSQCANNLTDNQCRDQTGCEWNSLAGCRPA